MKHKVFADAGADFTRGCIILKMYFKHTEMLNVIQVRYVCPLFTEVVEGNAGNH